LKNGLISIYYNNADLHWEFFYCFAEYYKYLVQLEVDKRRLSSFNVDLSTFNYLFIYFIVILWLCPTMEYGQKSTLMTDLSRLWSKLLVYTYHIAKKHDSFHSFFIVWNCVIKKKRVWRACLTLKLYFLKIFGNPVGFKIEYEFNKQIKIN